MKKSVCVLTLAALMLLSLCGCSTHGFIKKAEDIYNGILNTIKYGSDVTVIEESDPKDSFSRLCYDKIDSEQQRIYRLLMTAAEEMPDGWISMGRCEEHYSSDLTVAYQAFLCDNPQIFWMPSGYIISEDDRKNICVAFNYEGDDYQNEYLVQKKSRDEMRELLNQAVNDMSAAAMQYGTEFERELYIHDAICEKTVYNLESDRLIYSAYGALVDGVAVCEGYSRAMQLVANTVGIECGLVYGVSEGEGHMWNYIRIDGEWYHLDVTWDDSDDHTAQYAYFNVTAEEISADHIISPLNDASQEYGDKDSYNLLEFECAAQADNYFTKTGRILTPDGKAAASAIEKEAAEGKTRIHLKLYTTSDVEGALRAAQRNLRRSITLKEYSLSGTIVTVYW